MEDLKRNHDIIRNQPIRDKNTLGRGYNTVKDKFYMVCNNFGNNTKDYIAQANGSKLLGTL